MNTKRLMIGTVAGAITLYVVGRIIWGIFFADFFAANAGSATGVARDSRLEWAVILGSLAQGALLTLAVATRSGATSIGGGFKTGAIVGFLVWFSVDFIFYGVYNLSNLTATIVDPFLELVHWGIAGAAVAAVLGRTYRFDTAGV